MPSVFITGGSSGIGKELGKLFAEKGYDLILLSRTFEKLKKVKMEIEKEYSVECTIIEYNLNDTENIQKTVQIYDPDIVVNCAGIGTISKEESISVEKELEILNVNLIAPIIISKIFLRKFSGKKKGAIINICSMASLLPHPYMAGYSSSKSGLLFYSLSASEEQKRNNSGIKIISVCPGSVDTGFFSKEIKRKFGRAVRCQESAKNSAKEIMKAYEKNKSFEIIGKRNRIIFKLSKLLPFSVRIKIIEKILRKGIQ